MSNIEHRVELLEHPDRLIVRVHEELPRDPKRPHFVQTRPVDQVYVPHDAGAIAALEQIATEGTTTDREIAARGLGFEDWEHFDRRDLGGQ